MGAIVILTLKVYLLAIVISMAVAVAIRGIVIVLSRTHPVEPPGVRPHTAMQAQTPSEKDVAAIAAAVYAVMGEHRIVSIRTRRGGWTTEGRLAQHSSHNVSHHPHPR